MSSAIDQYFGLDFYTETKCVESEEEEVTKSTEHFLQYNCYIDKDVKYLHTGLMNVSCPVKNEVGLYLIITSFSTFPEVARVPHQDLPDARPRGGVREDAEGMYGFILFYAVSALVQ